MKRVLMINTANFGSTGKIMLSIKKEVEKLGFEVKVAIAGSRSNKRNKDNSTIFINSIPGRNLHILLAKFTGLDGCFSILSTKRFIRKIDKWHPDIIHLHNLHYAYINLPILFNYIKKRNIPVIWTLHDCWSFTGKCPHFTMLNCEKWKTGCYDCPALRNYPVTYNDMSRFMFDHKKKWFNSVKDLTIVTPSKWLADLIPFSFLKNYPTIVINNGIDRSVFSPTENPGVLKKYGISQEKFIILGVAMSWSESKGIDVFHDLQKRLDKNKYQIVLVGIDDELKSKLSEDIVCIKRTDNAAELAAVYSKADVFVNPTVEDTFPTVNIEALSCGTPIITFNVGGSPEIPDETCGIVINPGETDILIEKIKYLCNEKPFSSSACLTRAEKYIDTDKYKEYAQLYEKVYDAIAKNGI